MFRKAWRVSCWQKKAVKLQFLCLEGLLRLSTVTKERWEGRVCIRWGQGARWGWSWARRRGLSSSRWGVASPWCPPSPLVKLPSMTRWSRLKGKTIKMTFLSAGKQGGLTPEEDPGLANLNSRLCSGHLPRSRHLPVQFWNRPSQVWSSQNLKVILSIQKTDHSGGGGPNSCQADFKPE